MTFLFMFDSNVVSAKDCYTGTDRQVRQIFGKLTKC